MSAMTTRSPLAQLIDSARAPEKLSYQDIADLATKRGVRMSKSNVNRLVNDYPLASVSGDNIRGLAIALGLSERRVAIAALASMDVALSDESTPLRQAILDSDEVGESSKRILLAVIADSPAGVALELADQARDRRLGRGDYAKAARSGQSTGRADRRRQDEEGTAPDPEGPDFGV